MRAFNAGRRITLGVCTLAIACASLPFAASPATAAKEKSQLPVVTTLGATHVLASSALLTATIHTSGLETAYYFDYGLTTAYGSQTPQLKLAATTAKAKVGQQVSGLQLGVVYHYRVVAVNAAGRREGRDHTLITTGTKPRFVIPKPAVDVFGSPMIFTGSLTGSTGPNHRVALQASPYPFLESFTNVGVPGVTDRFGRFAFRVANLTSNTQFRVVTLDALPIYSAVVTVRVAVRVSFSVRSNPRGGLVRLYGTVTPAVPGARVVFQVLKPVRPGKNEEATRYVGQFTTTVKRGGRTFSRFSTIVKIHRGGRYRASVLVRPGPVVSAVSTRTIVLRAAPTARRKK